MADMARRMLSFANLHEFAVNEGARTITGLAVPWNKVARNNGTNWRFERGGIGWADLKRVKLLRDHDNGQALGKAIAITDTEEGLVVTFSVAPGRAGDEALALAAAEVLDGLSIGVEWSDQDFAADPLNPGAFLVTRANLREVSLTAVPAFDDSRLTSVRASDDPEKGPVMPENQNPETPAVTPVTPPVTAPAAPAAVAPAPAPAAPAGVTLSDAQFAALLAAHTPAAPAVVEPVTPVTPERPTVDPTARPTTGATFVAEPLPYRFTHQPRKGAEAGKHIFHAAQHEFSSDLFAMMDGRDADGTARKRVTAMIKAAFADVDTTDVAGLIPKRQAPELWQPQMDYATPLWDMINAGTTDGTPFELPKFSSASGLVVPAVEGTEPAAGAMAVTTQTITPTAVWGKVQITRQAIRRQGNPQISGVIWDQMLREYYEDREAAVATFLNTLTAAADITLTGRPAATPDNDDDQVTVGDLQAGIARLQFARGGNRFTAFAVQQDLYELLARVTDDMGRPLYPMINPQNANGTANTLYSYINVAGTTAVGSWALGAGGATTPQNSWLFDPAKVRGWASTPERLDWNFGADVQTNNVTQLAYVTMGIYGDIALGNLDINGVRQVIFDPSV